MHWQVRCPRPAVSGLAVVVSIGKLAPGQARYYLDQAGEPVSAADALASGAEDYYLGGSEAAGQWLGGGATALSLSGTVEADALHAVLAGTAPDSGTALRRNGSVTESDRPRGGAIAPAPRPERASPCRQPKRPLAPAGGEDDAARSSLP